MFCVWQELAILYSLTYTFLLLKSARLSQTYPPPNADGKCWNYDVNWPDGVYRITTCSWLTKLSSNDVQRRSVSINNKIGIHDKKGGSVNELHSIQNIFETNDDSEEINPDRNVQQNLNDRALRKTKRQTRKAAKNRSKSKLIRRRSSNPTDQCLESLA
jgi:hypothetical protein